MLVRSLVRLTGMPSSVNSPRDRVLPPSVSARRPGRVAGVRTLVVLGTNLALISVLAIWVNRLALDTDTWVDTSDALIADDAVRAALAATLTDSLYSSVDIASSLVFFPAALIVAYPVQDRTRPAIAWAPRKLRQRAPAARRRCSALARP